MLWHWSTDAEELKKRNPEGFKLWRLKYLINYGLEDGEKLSRKEVIANWEKIKEDLDPYKRRYLEFLLWGKLYLLPNSLNFWNLPAKKNR